MRKVEWLVTEAETEPGRPSKRGKKKTKQWLLSIITHVQRKNMASQGVLFEWHYSLFTALVQSHYQ